MFRNYNNDFEEDLINLLKTRNRELEKQNQILNDIWLELKKGGKQ